LWFKHVETRNVKISTCYDIRMYSNTCIFLETVRHLGKFTYKVETPLYRLYNIILLYCSEYSDTIILTLLFSSDPVRIPADALRKPVVGARVFVLIAFSDEKTHRSVNIKTWEPGCVINGQYFHSRTYIYSNPDNNAYIPIACPHIKLLY